MHFDDHFGNLKDSVGIQLGSIHEDGPLHPAKGECFIELRDDATGKLLERRHLQNIITHDASILMSILATDKNARDHGILMLAVGTGASGAVLSPDAPDKRQRRLNAEIARKPFLSTVFRDGAGNASSVPTNIVDYTARFGAGEASGPLNEMGLVSPISANPLSKAENPDTFPNRDLTLDLTQYDILVNYLTFGVITKPATASLAFTWRITF